VRRILTLLTLCLCWVLFASGALAEQGRVEKGNLVIEGIPEIPERILDRLNQYQSTRTASLQGWLPSGEGFLIKTRFGETQQIHLVKSPGGARRQITFFHEPVDKAWVSPNPEVHGFLFTRDVGGSELYQIFFFDLETGTYQLLTDGRSRNGDVRWSNRGHRFVFSTTKRNGRDWDLHIADISQPGSSRPVLEKTGAWEAQDWSPDDAKLLVRRYVSINEVYPYILDMETEELTPFHPTDKRVSYGNMLYAKDGRGIYFTSDQNSEFLRLQYYDLAEGQITVMADDISWDVEGFALSDDGKHLAFTVNEEGMSALHLMDLTSMQEVYLPALPRGRIYGLHFDPEGTKLGLVLNTPQHPGDVFTLDLSSREIVRWTFSEVGGLKGEDLVTPELIRYETFDQVDGQPRTTSAFYYRPRGSGPFPVLIDIHGGPERQARPSFNSLRQYFIKELGIAVLRPNVRGSSGYGKSYLLLDNGYKREDSVRDIGALLDWIAEQPELDSDRVVLFGSSYGGYMVLGSMTHYNHRLRAAIEKYGISNFVTFLENTKDYRRDLRRAEYGDERDPQMREFLTQISPTSNAAKITKPLFIFQGLNDPRVPVTESEQMVENIRENGGVVWYLLAKDEGHGLSKKTNRDYFNSAVILFLERFLLEGEGTP
jgi:dipeptidyl aminopeptidase/acylaminoacyl peptidase